MSGQYTEGRTVTEVASAALADARLVRLDGSGEMAYCAADSTDWYGVTTGPALAADDLISVILRNAQGTVRVTASEAITKGATIYQAANGKVATTGTITAGVAREAASGDGVIFEAVLSKTAQVGTFPRSVLVEDALQPYSVKVRDLYVWDAIGTNPVTTAGNDDLALTYNTLGTAAPTIEGADAKAATKTNKIGFQIVLPPEYVAAGDVKLRINAGMKTTVSDGTATVDVNAYRQDAPTVDICATAAQSINSLTAANKDFVLTATDLTAGQVIDVVVTVAVTDSATATAVIGKINKLIALLDIKG